MANWFSNFFFLSPIGARPSVKTETVVAVPRLLVRVRHVRLEEGRETTVYEIEQLQGLNCAQRSLTWSIFLTHELQKIGTYILNFFWFWTMLQGEHNLQKP
ncbi:hypothetical protein PC123_g26494 [Phytophthora cactorum]|nr:hypothetical protein PC123_g26494 [Phytophthora cactorum]